MEQPRVVLSRLEGVHLVGLVLREHLLLGEGHTLVPAATL